LKHLTIMCPKFENPDQNYLLESSF